MNRYYWTTEANVVDDKYCLIFFSQDDKGALKDVSVVRMFLMMHPWYIPSTDMAKKLVLKYPLKLKPNLFKLFCSVALLMKSHLDLEIKISRGQLYGRASNKNMPPYQVMNDLVCLTFISSSASPFCSSITLSFFTLLLLLIGLHWCIRFICFAFLWTLKLTSYYLITVSPCEKFDFITIWTARLMKSLKNERPLCW